MRPGSSASVSGLQIKSLQKSGETSWPRPARHDESPPNEPSKRRPKPLDLPGENGDIAALLRQAAGAQRLAEERLLADLGVTPPQLAALALIGAHPGLLAADLARKARLTPQTVQLIVANLRRAGLSRGRRTALRPRRGRGRSP